MLEVLGAEPTLANAAGDGYAPRPPSRPLTKFEQRGLERGHGVRDLVFTRRELARAARVAPASVGAASASLRPQSCQTTTPLHAVARTTRPNAIRYHANGTKVWVET